MKYLPPRTSHNLPASSSPTDAKTASSSSEPCSYLEEQRRRQQQGLRSVCVIGLGPAGVTTVKELRARGLHVTAYDALRRVGGRTFGANPDDRHYFITPDRAASEFSDFPWKRREDRDRGSEAFPTVAEAHAYLESYSQHFGLGDSMQFGTTVVRMEYDEIRRAWSVATRPTKDEEGRCAVDHFDAVVVCCGRRHLLGEESSACLPPSLQSKVVCTDPATGSSKLLLYQHTLVPGLPSLAFCGDFDSFECATGPAFAAWELCARYIAGVFSGQILRPPRWHMEEWCVNAARHRAEHVPEGPAGLSTPLLAELADLVGASPSLWWRVLHHYHPRGRSVVFPCIFRLNSPDARVADAARKRFEECWAEATQRNQKPHQQTSSAPPTPAADDQSNRPSILCC